MKLDDLEKLADDVDVDPYVPSRTRADIATLEIAWSCYRHAVNPQTIKQMIALIRLQHEALTLLDYGTRYQEANEAIATYEEFNKCK